MLRSDFCDYSNSYIVLKGRITVIITSDVNAKNGRLPFKHDALFRSRMSLINNTFIYNVEDLDIVMLMHMFLEDGKNYSMASGSLWNYYRVEVHDANNHMTNNNKTTTCKSFKYKTKIKGSTSDDNIIH